MTADSFRKPDMSPPTTYDPSSDNEKPVPLPSAPLEQLFDNVALQPPLSRLGTGPGVILFLPAPDRIPSRKDNLKIIDPEPVTKWAEEGYAVVSITENDPSLIDQTLGQGLDALATHKSVDTKIRGKFVVIGEHFTKYRLACQ